MTDSTLTDHEQISSADPKDGEKTMDVDAKDGEKTMEVDPKNGVKARDADPKEGEKTMCADAKDDEKTMDTDPNVREETNDNNPRNNEDMAVSESSDCGETTDCEMSDTDEMTDIDLSDLEENDSAEREKEDSTAIRTEDVYNPVEFEKHMNQPESTVHDKNIEEEKECITSGVYESYSESTKSLWDKETGRNIFRATMSLDTFWALSRIIRFDNKSTHKERRKLDNLATVRDRCG
ncbi:hypothetical protein TNCT_90701 [Trichonephila clavata]|uniref:Uncharacterized protein n=1 Tax=Trichonephila clavata TaxID=2740835 RepID=A0A8X6I3U6_TRICU|nr:hypothetical protein TNCT_90701 [Trichonephila clavata]